jgi:hypothetical protein
VDSSPSKTRFTYRGGSATNFGLRRFLQVEGIKSWPCSIVSWPFNSRKLLNSRLRGSVPHVLQFFLQFFGKSLTNTSIWPSPWIWDSTYGSGATFHKECDFCKSYFSKGFSTTRVVLKTFKRRTRGRLGTTWEDFKTTQDLLEHLLALCGSSTFEDLWLVALGGAWKLLAGASMTTRIHHTRLQSTRGHFI